MYPWCWVTTSLRPTVRKTVFEPARCTSSSPVIGCPKTLLPKTRLPAITLPDVAPDFYFENFIRRWQRPHFTGQPTLNESCVGVSGQRSGPDDQERSSNAFCRPHSAARTRWCKLAICETHFYDLTLQYLRRYCTLQRPHFLVGPDRQFSLLTALQVVRPNCQSSTRVGAFL